MSLRDIPKTLSDISNEQEVNGEPREGLYRTELEEFLGAIEDDEVEVEADNKAEEQFELSKEPDTEDLEDMLDKLEVQEVYYGGGESPAYDLLGTDSENTSRYVRIFSWPLGVEVVEVPGAVSIEADYRDLKSVWEVDIEYKTPREVMED